MTTVDPKAYNPAGDAERRDPVSKAIRMLDWMVDSGRQSWGVREVARGLNIAPSTAHRTLSTLEAAGVLTSEDDSRQYRISVEFLRLAARAAGGDPIRRAALPHMRTLVQSTGETAYLGVYSPRRQKMMYVDSVQSAHPLQYVLPQFEWEPMYAGAGGLGILPFLPPGEIEDVLSHTELVPLTDQTITDRAELERELERIRRNGYVISVGRLIAGTAGIAAPIFGPDNHVLGDILLALPGARLSRELAEPLAGEVAAAAARVTIDLGGTPWSTSDSVRR